MRLNLNLQNQISTLTESKNRLENQINELEADKAGLQDQIAVMEQILTTPVVNYLGDTESSQRYVDYLDNVLHVAQSSQSMPEKIRDSVMYYLDFGHNLGCLVQNLTWTGGLVEGFIDTETCVYTSGDWGFTIFYYQEVPNSTYVIRANHNSVAWIARALKKIGHRPNSDDLFSRV